MATKEIKTYTLAEMKDKYIGKDGTKERERIMNMNFAWMF